jgi:hypothetical protein
MNRGIACLLFSVVSALGCGARTETLEFGSDGIGGAPNAGAPNVAGAPAFAGGPSSGGAPNVGGAPSFGGAATFAGAPSFGGALFAGGPSFGGAPNFAGAPSVGGAAGGIGGSGGEGGVIVNACIAIAANACDKCLCTSCSSSVVSCFSDAQCTSIFSCIARTGCQGIGCYTNNTCRTTIDANGGIGGPAVGEVFSLVTCAVQSQSNCACN